MSSLARFYHRFRWLHAPTALLSVLLQRAPALRIVAQVESILIPQATNVVRSVFTLAALGAYDSVAGATASSTTFIGTPTSPTTVTPSTGRNGVTFNSVGTTSQSFNLAFGVLTLPGIIPSWSVSGALPPGITIANSTASSATQLVASGLQLSLSGLPTTGGLYPLTITYSPTKAVLHCKITINAAPSFTTQPVSQTVAPKGKVVFTTAASGYPAPKYQWYHGTSKLTGKTTATLTLTGLTAASAGDYYVTATNTSGTVQSSIGTLTVSSPVVAKSLARTKAVVLPFPETAIFKILQPNQSYTATIAQLPGLTYSASGLPAWAELDAKTGIISGIPSAGDTGVYPIVLTGNDATRAVVSAEILIQVQ